MNEVIKQLGVYNNGQWTKVGIGTDADKVDLESNILGQNNVQKTLNAAFGANKLTSQKVVITNAQGQLTTSNLNATNLNYLSNTKENIQNQINNVQSKIDNISTNNITVNPSIAGEDNLQDLLRSTIGDSALQPSRIVIADQYGRLTTDYASPLIRGPVYRTNNITQIISVNSSNATIAEAQYAQFGQIAQLFIRWTNKNDISVPVNGNIVNITIGNLTSDKKPAIFTGAWSRGDNAGAAWYSISDVSGGVALGAVEAYGTTTRTIKAGANFELMTTYILPQLDY